MASVVPTVLAATPEEYATMLARAEGLSQRVHVDMCDGRFADSRTVGLAQVHVSDGVALDLHLMLQDPVSQLETALSLKPHLIIFHAESGGDLAAAMTHVRELGVQAGLALLPRTPVAAAGKLIQYADHVLIFTGELGHNGGKFDMEQLGKAAEIRATKPDVEISVDGGVSDQNAAIIILQGVDVLYSGAFLQESPDPGAAFKSIEAQAGVAA